MRPAGRTIQCHGGLGDELRPGLTANDDFSRGTKRVFVPQFRGDVGQAVRSLAEEDLAREVRPY